MDSHIIEPQEYNDRYSGNIYFFFLNKGEHLIMSEILAYQHKIAQLWNTVNHPKTEPCGLLKDIPNPQLVLAPAPISNDDLFFVSKDTQ